MPSSRARSAAGSSAASWDSALVSCLSGVDADHLEPLSKLLGADRAAGLAAAEQPGRGTVSTGGGVSALADRELQHQVRERVRQDDGD